VELEEVDIYTPFHWSRQLPAPAKPGITGGKPLALTKERAGQILASVAQGVKPKAAFLIAGLSAETYQRYQNGVNKHKNGQPTQNPNIQYIVAFFELQDHAQEAAIMQYANAQSRALSGETLKSSQTKTKTTKRQAVIKGEVVELVDTEITTTENYKERAPRLPKTTNFIDKNYF
jgi:hypothetical protein